MLKDIKFAVKKHPLYKNLRQFKRQLLCKHTHTFRQDLPEADWLSHGELKGRHGQIVLEGCYICGKVTVRDYGR